MFDMKVVNKYKEKYDVYIGRGSKYGNPYPVKEFGLGVCIKYFKVYFILRLTVSQTSIRNLQSIARMSGIRLGCFCKPKDCHGDFIVEVAGRLNELESIDDFEYFIKNQPDELCGVLSRNLKLFDLSLEDIPLPSVCNDILRTKSLKETLVLCRDILRNDKTAYYLDPMITNITSLDYKKRLLAVVAISNFNRKDCEFRDRVLDTFLINNIYSPEYNGITHINVLYKSHNRLGNLLSNLSSTGFTHDTYGSFASMEAFWYWYGCDKNESVRGLYGHNAKKIGSGLEKKHADDFMDKIEECLRLKIIQNEELLSLVLSNKLPLTHYFNYGGKIVWTNDLFITTLSRVCESIQKEYKSTTK